MVLSNSDLELHLSGGSTNSNVFASLGGALSSQLFISDLFNNMWPDPTPEQYEFTDYIDYSIAYLKNKNTQDPINGIHAYFSVDDPNIGMELSHKGLNVLCGLLPDRTTAPPTSEIGLNTDLPAPFQKTGTTYENTSSIIDLPAGAFIGVLFQRKVPHASLPIPDVIAEIAFEDKT